MANSVTLRRHSRLAVGEAPQWELPERRLLTAMLMQALLDLQGRGVCTVKGYSLSWSEARRRKRTLQKRGARRWFQSRRTTEGSFLWICELLELDAHAVRAAIRPSHNTRYTSARENGARVHNVKNLRVKVDGLAEARTRAVGLRQGID